MLPQELQILKSASHIRDRWHAYAEMRLQKSSIGNASVIL